MARERNAPCKYSAAHGGREAPEKRCRGDVEVAAGGVTLTGRGVGRDVQDRTRSKHVLQRRLSASIGFYIFVSAHAPPTIRSQCCVLRTPPHAALENP